jgi:hypothetical protein
VSALFRPIASRSGLAAVALALATIAVFGEPFIGPFAAWAVS